MDLTEYSKTRAEILNFLNLTDSDSPFKVQWLELANSNNKVNSFSKTTHSHTFFEIHFVFSGNISYKINNKHIDLAAYQAFILPPKTPHKILEFNGEILKASLTFIAEDEILKSITEPIRFDFDNSVIKNMNDVLKLTEKCDVLSVSVIKGKIFEILNSVFDTLNVRLPYLNTNYKDARLNTAISFINSNLYSKFTCDDVAKECCLSIKQMDRIFKKHLDISLHEYIVKSRLNIAKRLINSSEYSFKEIAYKLGFKNESGFNIFFKHHTGTTPGEYRKKYNI